MSQRLFQMSFASVYIHYLAKAAKTKGRTRDGVNEIICWLTGYSQCQLDTHLAHKTRIDEFFSQSPQPNLARHAITGSICGVRIEAMEPGLMREIRYLDKLVDELAKGKPMAKVLRAQNDMIISKAGDDR